MQFCINNLTKDSPDILVGEDSNFPFENCRDDTLQTSGTFTDITMYTDYYGNVFHTDTLKKFIIVAPDNIGDDIQVTISNSGGPVNITSTIIPVTGILIFDFVSFSSYSGPLTSVRVEATIYSVQPAIFAQHMYFGNPYTLPRPDYGSVPNRPSNDDVFETQSGRVLYTEGHTTRQQGFAVREVSKTSYDTFTAYWDGDDRRKPFIFFQTEDDTELFPPWFARILGEPEFINRTIPNKFAWNFEIREAF